MITAGLDVIADTKMLNVAKRWRRPICPGQQTSGYPAASSLYLPPILLTKQKIDGFNTRPVCSWDKDDQDTTP